MKGIPDIFLEPSEEEHKAILYHYKLQITQPEIPKKTSAQKIPSASSSKGIDDLFADSVKNCISFFKNKLNNNHQKEKEVSFVLSEREKEVAKMEEENLVLAASLDTQIHEVEKLKNFCQKTFGSVPQAYEDFMQNLAGVAKVGASDNILNTNPRTKNLNDLLVSGKNKLNEMQKLREKTAAQMEAFSQEINDSVLYSDQLFSQQCKITSRPAGGNLK